MLCRTGLFSGNREHASGKEAASYAVRCNEKLAQFCLGIGGERRTDLPDAVSLAPMLWEDVIVSSSLCVSHVCAEHNETYGQVIFYDGGNLAGPGRKEVFMKAFIGNNIGRYVIIGLQKDDLVLESIQKVIDENGIRNAIVTSGIGAAYHMRWHHIKNTDDRPTDMIHELDGPMEISSIGGLVIDGKPHLHCAFADHDRAFVGHLEEGCKIQYVGEISMIELLDVDLARIADEFGVKHLDERE